jgi:hypothetical protein
METILHWDFMPGLALPDQVRSRFGSTVHFSPSSPGKEFFLVVSFSSASFVLSVESVGLALQCCIGGDARGFRVYQLSDRRFRFSVASNKVGHFIYGLHDRIWPDFVCHFSLFHGDHPRRSGFVDHVSTPLVPSKQDLVVAQRSPTLLRPNLEVVAASSAKDASATSELAKFGFKRSVSSPSMVNSNPPTVKCNDQVFMVGQISIPLITDRILSLEFTSMGSNFPRLMCQKLPVLTLEILEDQRQAGYSEADIMCSLNLPFIPPKDLVFEFIGRCYRCGLKDHL